MSTFSSRPRRIEPGRGQESAWDYPRPPRLERVTARLRVVFGGVTVADTIDGHRVLETSHPPNYYFPPEDILEGAIEATKGASFCEWKGRAHYFTVKAGGRVAPEAAWGYASPSEAFAEIADHVAFYVAPMDACFVDEEQAVAQPGAFYGGWITDAVVGPFKGAPGSRGW